MKTKSGFMRRKLGTQEVIVAVGEASKQFSGIIRLNETGAFLWDKLAEGDMTEQKLVEALLGEYDVPQDIAERDVANFVKTVRDEGMLDD
ncbi:MAG: PqqD family protein [Clostridia bacterium]|nr:PqqD family protein [Clostridia bacterium]MBQ2939908.1 PqqD family protein [Clostridia bacterium]